MLSEQQQRIMGYFIEEAKDHLNTIEQGLLNLQATIADPEMANEVFRAAHSVKGGAAMLGLTSIQNTSHRLEDYFKVLKECPIKIDQKLETLLLRVYDTLQELLEQLQGPFGLTDDKAEEAMVAVEPTFTELNQHLSQLVSQAGAQTPEDVDLAVVTAIPVVARPAPVRATTEESALRFIFQNDIPARLREMLQLFKQADTPETRQQLQSLCQTLAQPGEQLDLLDWCQLLDAVERAIINSDNTYRTLAPVVIKEIKRAQEQILTGNLAQITASADLLALVPLEPLPTAAEVTDTDLADLLDSTDGLGDEFDLFSEEVVSSEPIADDLAEFSGASPEASFTDEPEFELTLDTSVFGANNGDDALDLSFIDQFDSALPALSNHQAGPEVGAAELNSLADLFGEESDLGLAWQEEAVDESVENEPESLELDDPSSDFSDLLFQDSEALELDESEEDLSGLLNKTAQQVNVELVDTTDAFTFGGTPASEADLANFSQELIFSDPPPSDQSALSQPAEAELNLEPDLFGEESPESADLGLDVLFSEAVPDSSQQDDSLGSASFDRLFGDAPESLADSSLADDFNFDAELGSEFGGSSDAADMTSDLALDAELDTLALSDLELSLDAADEMPEIFEADLSPLPLESVDLLESDLSPSDLEAASSPSPDADLGVWQPAIADPWSEGSQPDAMALDEPELAASGNLFDLNAEDAVGNDVSWMGLELSESDNSLDLLDSDLESNPVDTVESLSRHDGNELNRAELDFQTLDGSTLEVLNQTSLELTADEAADLDFNFDEADQTVFDATAFEPPSAGSNTESAFDLLTDDAENLDLSFDEELAAPSVDAVEDEVTFHFGASTDSVEAAGLDDLMNEFDTSDLELDLFSQSEAEPIVAGPISTSDLDENFNGDFDFASGDTIAADLQSGSSQTELDAASELNADLLNAEIIEVEDLEIDALLAEPVTDQTAEGELTDLGNLDGLDLDEFALLDDFSEIDSTSTVSSSETSAEENTAFSNLFGADRADSAPEAATSETIDFDAAFNDESSFPDATVEPPAENPFANRTLETLFGAESELESPAAASDDFDLFGNEANSFEMIPLQAEEAEIDLDQTIDMRLFDPEFASEPLFALDRPNMAEAVDLPTDLLEPSFDLFATEGADSENLGSELTDSELEFDSEMNLADGSGFDAELATSGDAAAEFDSGLAALNFEELETDDFGNVNATSANATAEQLLDAAFSGDGVEDENLLEFVPDPRSDSASENDLATFETFDDRLLTDELLTDELSVGGLGDELSNDLSLDFDLASPERESTQVNAGSASAEASDSAFDFSDLETLPSAFDFGADLSDDSQSGSDSSMDELFSANSSADLSNELELNFDQDFGDVNSTEEAEEAAFELDLLLSDDLALSSLEVEPSAPDLADLALSDDDLNSANLNTLDFDSDLNDDLDSEAAVDFNELDSVDLELDAETASSANLIAEGDLNDLDLDGLFEADSLPSQPSLLNHTEMNAESSDAPVPFDSSPSQTEFGDLDLMLAADGSVDLGAVSAEPAGFDDLEAMLAEEPLPITAIHIEEDVVEAEEENKAASEALSLEAADDFADLEALLGDVPVTGAVDFAVPVSSPPIEVEDEFGDLEALLQDADQALGVGSSPTRKASTTANRRPGRRGGLNEQTMRVTVKHLDNLNNLVGEMVVNRNSLEQAEERLRQFLDNLLYQVQQLSDVGQRMRDLYERSLLESSLLSGRRGSMTAPISGFGSGGQPNHAAGMSFDALEMDRFTGFHVLSQEMIELIVRVRESASDIDFVVEETDQVTRNFRQITTQLQEGLTRSRMVPFSQTADRLPRGVRDNSLKYGKQAELIIEGRDTLIDKMIVEQLYDPMTHLVNNAIAHGIETPEERIAAGKSPTGQIVIRTFHQGNQTVISVSDDGAGINPEKVRAKALAKGLINAEQAREMTRLDTYDLLFHHGFSTVDQIDDLRGRGVGLDVVRNNLNEIRGTISIDSTVGKGTTFTIRLPLTLSISKALCCISHRARIAFPMDGVEDMLDVPKERIQTDEHGRPCIQWRDVILPFQPLSDLLRYNRVLGRGSVYGGNQEEDVISIVVLRSAGNFLALQVDQVLGEQEIVIKQLEGPVPKPLGVAGATVLGDGRIMPIADVLELIDLWQGRIRRESGGSLWDKGESQLPPEPPTKTESTVLIVDDSITVRELLSMTFNKVGYRVEQARDGQEAWEKLRAGLPCDLVFCDIEMPRMDGLELLSRIQKDSNLSHLPIAMLTSRGADRHRQMAVQLGAKGYFTKPYLEEVLLDAAQRMLKGEVMISGVNTQ